MNQTTSTPTGALSLNPNDGQVIKHFPFDSQPAVENALQQSFDGFSQWRNSDMAQRVGLLHAIASELRKQARPLAQLMTQEMGKVITQSLAEVEKCAKLCEWYAENGPAFLARESTTVENNKAYVDYLPIGPILAVMPWNSRHYRHLSGEPTNPVMAAITG